MLNGDSIIFPVSAPVGVTGAKVFQKGVSLLPYDTSFELYSFETLVPGQFNIFLKVVSAEAAVDVSGVHKHSFQTSSLASVSPTWLPLPRYLTISVIVIPGREPSSVSDSADTPIS